MHPPASTQRPANVTATLWRRAAAHDPNDVFRVWRGGAWRGLTCTEVADRVRDLAAGLIAQGVAAGDRVALLGGSGVDWALADLAVLAAGGVAVPRDGVDARGPITEAGYALVLDTAALDAVAACAGEAQRREVMVRVEATTEQDRALALHAPDAAGVLQEQCLTHGDVAALVRRAATAPLERPDTVLLCGPLGDIAGQVLLLQCLEAGATLAFPRAAETVLEDLQSFSPTVVSATAATFQDLVDATRARAEGQRSRTFDFAVSSAVQWAGRAGPRRLDTIRRSISDKLVYRDLRDAMGGQVRHSLCSHGTLGGEVAAVFAAADIPIERTQGTDVTPR